MTDRIGPLRLIAHDQDDLAVISATVQDALFRAVDVEYDKRTRRFAAPVVRFRWERAQNGHARKHGGERIVAGLQVESVLRAQARGVDQSSDTPTPVLAVTFEPAGEGPQGVVKIILAGGGDVALQVECLDVTLADISRPWPARSRPSHGEE